MNCRFGIQRPICTSRLTYLAVLALVRLLTQTLRRAVDHQTDAVVHARVPGTWRGGDGVRIGGRGVRILAAWTPVRQRGARALAAVTGAVIGAQTRRTRH